MSTLSPCYSFVSCLCDACTLAPSASGTLFITPVSPPWTQRLLSRCTCRTSFPSQVAAHSSLQLSTTSAGNLIVYDSFLNMKRFPVLVASACNCLIVSLSRIVNVGQTLLYEDSEESSVEPEPIRVRVPLDLQSFVGFHSISAHVIGIFIFMPSTWACPLHLSPRLL